ncbi:hypothetical protein Tco_1448838 [Tanacetum coccineum]
MDDPNITIEEYIRLEEEKARRRAIVLNDALTSEVMLSCEPTDCELLVYKEPLSIHDIVVVDVVEVVVLFDDVVMDGYEIVVFAGAEMLAG